MVACICHHVTETELRELIRDGYDTIDKLKDFGICLGCQRCVPFIEQYIEEELSQ